MLTVDCAPFLYDSKLDFPSAIPMATEALSLPGAEVGGAVAKPARAFFKLVVVRTKSARRR
jgi:hypothetical protein